MQIEIFCQKIQQKHLIPIMVTKNNSEILFLLYILLFFNFYKKMQLIQILMKYFIIFVREQNVVD